MVPNLAVSIPAFEFDAEVTPFVNVPLTELSRNTRRQLSNSLNSRKILRSEEGFERDWRGIASLAELKCDDRANFADPMKEVLDLWCRNNPQTATFAYLQHFLGMIDRWDVSDDLYENLLEDVKNYNKKLQKSLNQNNDLTTNTTASLSNLDECDTTTLTEDIGPDSNVGIITEDDMYRAQKGLPYQKYDAFVLYADADIHHAIEMASKLESPGSNIKLFLKNRDLLFGGFEHVAVMRLIEERCKYVIVILTKEFINSPLNTFFVEFAQASQIQKNAIQIIPALYDEGLVMPLALKYLIYIKYSATITGIYDFWDKLAARIGKPALNTAVTTNDTPSPVYTSELRGFSVSRNNNNNNNKDESLANLPTPPPEIKINDEAFVAEDDKPQKKDKNNRNKKYFSLQRKTKKFTLDPISSRSTLRNAKSTSQLDGTCCVDENGSMSNLSISSVGRQKSNKGKVFGKILKRISSSVLRSNSKLQEPA